MKQLIEKYSQNETNSNDIADKIIEISKLLKIKKLDKNKIMQYMKNNFQQQDYEKLNSQLIELREIIEVSSK